VPARRDEDDLPFLLISIIRSRGPWQGNRRTCWSTLIAPPSSANCLTSNTKSPLPSFTRSSRSGGKNHHILRPTTLADHEYEA
jgi:hypothetical protein